MANKRSKACSQNKKPTSPNDQNPQLHLPRKFACLIPPRTNRISEMVVTKSWGTLPRLECRKNPFIKTLPLVQIQSSNIAHTTNQIIRVPSSQYQGASNKRSKSFKCHNLKFIGYSEGSLVWTNGFKFGYYHTTCTNHFMDLKSGIHRACVAYFNHLNHFNPTACFNVVLTGISCPSIIIRERPKSWINCNISNLKWIKYGCNLVDPNDPRQGNMRFCTGIWRGDKFYALSLQGTLAVLRIGLDHGPIITTLGSGRAVPYSTTRHYREYLLEANGQILLVFLLSKKTLKIVDDVEVFGLDISNLSWVKMKRLGDMTALLLGSDCCVAVTTSNLDSECNSSCVYFTNIEFDGWKVYDMESCCIGEWKFEW